MFGRLVFFWQAQELCLEKYKKNFLWEWKKNFFSGRLWLKISFSIGPSQWTMRLVLSRCKRFFRLKIIFWKFFFPFLISIIHSNFPIIFNFIQELVFSIVFGFSYSCLFALKETFLFMLIYFRVFFIVTTYIIFQIRSSLVKLVNSLNSS